MDRRAAAQLLREAEREVRLAKAAVQDRRPGSTRRYLLALAMESAAQAQALFAVRCGTPPEA